MAKKQQRKAAPRHKPVITNKSFEELLKTAATTKMPKKVRKPAE